MPTERMTVEQYRAWMRTQGTVAEFAASSEFGDCPSLAHSSPASNKYHANKTTIDGITYDSTLEANRHQVLRLLERAGQIRDLQYHTRIVLQEAFRDPTGKAIRKIEYEPDFTYWAPKGLSPKAPQKPQGTVPNFSKGLSPNSRLPPNSVTVPHSTAPSREPWHFVIEDTKGYDTPVSKLKRKLLRAKLPYATIVIITTPNDPVGGHR